MDGILIIDKSAGMTSHDVVARVRRVLKTRRVGHTGTLDPFATGVMVTLIGRATRLAQFLDKDEKEYLATVAFGFETDTGDRTGEPKPSSGPSASDVSIADVEGVLDQFRGEIMQVPPMYSAKKVAGEKLYELARRGEIIERAAVRVNIIDLAVTGENAAGDIDLRVVCSAGTYIRTLAEDVGRAIGTGAHLAELRRTRAGRFTIDQAVELEELASLDEPANRLLPLADAISHLSELKLDEERVSKTRDGLSTRVSEPGFIDGEAVRMTSPSGEPVAVGRYVSSEGAVRPKVVL